ncbi:MAG: FAD-binding and (Fe-S)-binding domain-containing protein [Planctomycetia bacterium]|nr:FAD-binding and (Fe-S)-binding domain-containing protein [Planctomycetia bacterium]
MKHTQFLREIRRFVASERIYTDDLRRLAWGCDAGFYRLTPKIVVRLENEAEAASILQAAQKWGVPLTFRAAGTSLSGQSISDSVLLVAGKNWERCSIDSNGEKIVFQPGILGARINEILRPLGRKFGPDPASIKSAMAGGILMNNASGMNCGIWANSDKLLLSARMILLDGTILDTGNAQSRAAFEETHPEFLRKIEYLRDKIRSNPTWVQKIQKKYAIKNVMGLNLRPFVAYEDPFDIIAHLLVGSEGTLAFLAEASMRTLRDDPFRASAMLYFETLDEACRAVQAMKRAPVHCAELLDKKSLSSVGDSTGTNLTAVLTETTAPSVQELRENIRQIEEILRPFSTFTPVRFSDKPEEYAEFWNIRSGIFPAVGGTRPVGTTCLIEDVAFPIDSLPEATRDLQKLIEECGYDDACIYGHALEGNFHFVIHQKFDTQDDIQKYERLMSGLLHLVVDKYDGSLKAEHGTGRNMAPFVAYEWGEELFGMMRDVKKLFDPTNILNPGVIFNDDPACHLKNLKPLPLANSIIDRCIECGFCESSCASCGFTLSSRQRIVVQREIARLEQSGESRVAVRLSKAFRFPGVATCAGDGLCTMACPMGIQTAELAHFWRAKSLPEGSLGYRLGELAARRFAWLKPPMRGVLRVADLAHKILGTSWMNFVCRTLHRASFGAIPLWTPSMPRAFVVQKVAKEHTSCPADGGDSELRVVYFPSCINQAFGAARNAPDAAPLVEKTVAILRRAGYRVIFPERLESLCCGTIWESKGMSKIADEKSAELERALRHASNDGEIPILCDQSPCLYRMREKMPTLKLYEPVEFIETFLLDKLHFVPIDRPIAIHATCSMRKMKLEKLLLTLARRCSSRVVAPEKTGCCGFAGDKGFTLPTLNAYALRHLREEIEESQCVQGYSNSRTCEIGLSTHSGISYESIVYLVEECTRLRLEDVSALERLGE